MTASSTLAWSVGNGASKSTLATTFDGTETVKVMFSSSEPNDMQISYLVDGNWVVQAQQNSGFTSVAMNSSNIILGQEYDGLIKDLIIGKCTSFFCSLEPSIIGRWGFDPQDITPLPNFIPYFTGIISPTVRNHTHTPYNSGNAVYNMYRPASMEFISSSIGASAFSSAGSFYGFTPPVPEIMGGIGSAFAPNTTTPAYAQIGTLGEALEFSALGSSFTREAFLFFIAFVLSSIIIITVWMLTKSELITGLLYIMFMSIGASIDMYNMWYAILFSIFIMIILMLRIRLRT
jgi:hypothetical protein